MKSSKWVIQVLACGLCAAMAISSAQAAPQRGFYLGLSVGKSSFDIDQNELDDVVLDSFASVGAPVLTGSSSLEDSDTALALVAGYRFLPYVAIEASYLDLGTAEYRSSGTVNPPGPVTSTPASLSMDIKVKGLTIGGVGNLPIGQIVDLHGRLGLFVAKTDISAIATMGSSVGSDSDSVDSASLYVGVGAGFSLGEHWSLSLDWTRYDNVGDEDEDDDLDTEEGFNIDALSLSAMYRF